MSTTLALERTVGASSNTAPPVGPTAIGTFTLSSLNFAVPANTAILNRQEEELLPNRTVQVRHGSYLRKLHRGKPIAISTEINGGVENIESYMQKFGVAALMVVQNAQVLCEKYQYNNTAASRCVVQSITKSFLSTLLGVAVANGSLATSDRVWTYVPELAGTAYADATVQSLVDMTSGVVDPSLANVAHADPSGLFDLYKETDPAAAVESFKSYNRVAEPGITFNYFNPNYYVLSLVLSRAVGESIESQMTKHIWEPAGMQYDGYMRATGAGQVDGHGGLAMTVSDLARFGLFVLDAFHGRGGPAVPAGWFSDISAASTSVGARAPGAINDCVPSLGYQSGWWTAPRGGPGYSIGDDGGFIGIGTYGQSLCIIPKLNATIAIQSAYPESSPELLYQGVEFVTGIAKALRERLAVNAD